MLGVGDVRVRVQGEISSCVFGFRVKDDLPA